jgi:uncharacterized coiled-coil DUF342 family protein
MSDDPTSRILAAIAVTSGEIRSVRADLMDRIEAMGGEIRSLRGDLMDRIDRLQDDVSSLRDDIGVNFARSDRVDDRSTGIEREVRAVVLEVSAMHRQLQRLQTDVRTLKGGS